MIRDDFNNECAKALTQGIVDYFVSIQLTTPKPVTPEVSEPSSGVQSSAQTFSNVNQ